MSTTTTVPTNGQDMAVQAAATQAITENTVPIDPAASFNIGFPVEDPRYTNTTINMKFKTPRKDSKTGLPPVDNFGKPIEARTPVSLTFPVPTWKGLNDFVSKGQKNQDWLLDIVQDVVRNAVRDQVTDEANPVNTQDELKLDVLSLDFLVNVPKIERTGRGIAKEIWEEWSKDYIEVMTAAGTRSAEKVGNAAEAFMKKLNPVKTNKKLVEFLKNELNHWATLTNNLDEYNGIFEFLVKKADDLINTDEESQLNNFQ